MGMTVYEFYHLDAAADPLIASRLRSYWETTTGSLNLPSVKATLTSRDTNNCQDLMNFIITVGLPLEEHSSHDRDAPSLFWSAPCTLADGCKYLFPMITTLEYDRGGYPLGLELWDGHDIDMFPKVQHLVIVGAFKEGDVAYDRRRKDQRQLVDIENRCVEEVALRPDDN
jgi:hypothetical protein